MIANKFHDWLDQYVWVGNIMMKRREYIPDFAEALADFASAKGYTMDSSWKKGHLVVAKWLHAIHCQEYLYESQGKLAYPVKQKHAQLEDEDQFYHVITLDDVNAFMSEWEMCGDMSSDTRTGNRVLNEIHSLLWAYVDLDNSKQGDIVLARLEDSESDSEGGWGRPSGSGRVDQYIQDASEGYHGGRWAKV